MNTPKPNCLSEGELLALYYGETEGAAATAARAHLVACSVCAGRAHDITGVLGAVNDPVPEGGTRALRMTLSMLGIAERAAPATQSTADTEIMTLDEVAAFLRLDCGAMPALLTALPHFSVAGQIRVRRVALLAFVEKLEAETTLARSSGLSGLSLRQTMF